MDIQHWTKDQYHAFLLVSGAHSNYKVSGDEKLYITSLVGEHNFNFAEEKFKGCTSDIECIEILKKGRERFYPSEHDKAVLESELKTLFAADHDYHILEENFLRYLDKVL